MRIEIIRDTYLPGRPELKAGETQDLPEQEAKALIERDQAVPVEPKPELKETKSPEEPKKAKANEK